MGSKKAATEDRQTIQWPKEEKGPTMVYNYVESNKYISSKGLVNNRGKKKILVVSESD